MRWFLRRFLHYLYFVVVFPVFIFYVKSILEKDTTFKEIISLPETHCYSEFHPLEVYFYSLNMLSYIKTLIYFIYIRYINKKYIEQKRNLDVEFLSHGMFFLFECVLLTVYMQIISCRLGRKIVKKRIYNICCIFVFRMRSQASLPLYRS